MQIPNCNHPTCNNLVRTLSNGKLAKHCSRKCAGQHNSLKSREKCKETCLNIYGVENPRKLKSIVEKGKQTCLEKYGVVNPSQADSIKLKKKETTLLNFGVESPLQSQEVRDRVKSTNLERYGVENPFQSKDVKNAMKTHYLLNFGVEFVGQVQEVKDLIKKTNLERYGVENPSQSAEVQNKIMKKGITKKDYVFPSGKVVTVQGYEHYALDYYLTMFSEDEIIVGDATKIPVISYIDENGKSRKYFPDIFIPSKNLIIEVKSTYTYNKFKQRNICKKETCESLNYAFEFYIGLENNVQRNKRLQQYYH